MACHVLLQTFLTSTWSSTTTAIAAVVAAVAAVLAAAFTCWYALTTRSLLRLSRFQFDADRRAYVQVTIRTERVPNQSVIVLEVRNVGKLRAENVGLSLDQDIHINLQGYTGLLNERPLFTSRLPVLTPGQHFTYMLGDFRALEAGHSVLPESFTVTASYKTLGKDREEVSMMQVEQLRGTALPETQGYFTEHFRP
jgi:hypothetical protein